MFFKIPANVIYNIYTYNFEHKLITIYIYTNKK